MPIRLINSFSLVSYFLFIWNQIFFNVNLIIHRNFHKFNRLRINIDTTNSLIEIKFYNFNGLISLLRINTLLKIHVLQTIQNTYMLAIQNTNIFLDKIKQ